MYRVPGNEATVSTRLSIVQCTYGLCINEYVPLPLLQNAGQLEAVRRAQQRRWLWSHISWQLMARFRRWPGVAERVAVMEERVEAGSIAPGTAADLLLDQFFSHHTPTRDK